MIKQPSLDDFKKWMEQHISEPKEVKDDLVGTEVQAKVGLNKLLSKAEIEEGVEEDVCNEFFEDGGIILEVEDNKYLVEVSCGSFYIHKSYVRKN